MPDFFDAIPQEDAVRIDVLARLAVELRDNRVRLLEEYGVDDEAALLGKIALGEIDEHPAYDHYLSARILGESRNAVREELSDVLQDIQSK
ncbi:MAG: hypothetical protein ACYC42_07295 [Lysobacter sp.]